MDAAPKLKFAKRGRPTKAAVEAAQAVVAQREGPTRTDAELLAAIKERFEMMRELAAAAGKGQVPSLIIPGAPGIGKSYTVMDVLDSQEIKYSRITGGISAVELYAMGFHHRNRGEVIFIDDSDMVFRDEDTMNILKAMTDSSKKRTVSWQKQNNTLVNDGVDPEYEYKGSLIFASNQDFQRIVDESANKYAPHMAALISRAYYMDLLVHTRRALSLWINYICTEGKMFAKEDISDALGKEILVWLHDHQVSLREYSLRTVHKICALTKLHGRSKWGTLAEGTLCR